MILPKKYHVRVTRKSNRSRDVLELDLEKNELEERIVTRFLMGRTFMVGGQPITPNDVEAIHINATERPSKDLMPNIHDREQRRRANSNVVVLPPISDEWHVTNEGEDVTRDFIRFPPLESEEPEKLEKTPNKAVFIVHGTDFGPVKELKVILVEAGLNPIVLHEQASKGMTIIEKLEKYSDVGFAFMILTPDDMGFDGQGVKKLISSFMGKQNFTKKEFEFYLSNAPSGKAEEFVRNLVALFRDRARQNVVLEFGYFMGKLNRERICCLYKGDIELPSDMQGICYVHFDNSAN